MARWDARPNSGYYSKICGCLANVKNRRKAKEDRPKDYTKYESFMRHSVLKREKEVDERIELLSEHDQRIDNLFFALNNT